MQNRQLKTNKIQKYIKQYYFSVGDDDICDLIFDNGICSFEGQKLILKEAVPKGLIGYYNFDDNKPLDSSGKQNHGKKAVPAGPAFQGKGQAGYFNGGEYLLFPHTKDYISTDFSYTFWLYLIKVDENDSSLKKAGMARFCPILQKGEEDVFEKVYFRTPLIFFDRRERQLKIMITTTDSNKQPLGEQLVSNGKIHYQRWTHLAIVRQDQKTKLFINGIQDAVNVTVGYTQTNNKPMYVGSVPWQKEECSIPLLMDELRIYNRPLEDYEIEAEAEPALGGIEPSYIQLGCMNCPLDSASKACSKGYHLCSQIELHTGGYHVARIMGWSSWDSHVWSHKDQTNPTSNTPSNGLGICCKDLS